MKIFHGSKASGILPINKKGEILIGLRSCDVNEPYTWGNFGGAIDIDDNGEVQEVLSPEDNAIKELKEEIGYYGNIELINSYVFKNDNFTYYNFIGIVDNIDINDLDLNWEVDEVKWVNFDELLSISNLHFWIKSLINNSEKQILDIITNI